MPAEEKPTKGVLVPEIYISQCEVIASLPPITQRICFDKPSDQQARLPFRDHDVRRGVLAGKRPTPKTKFTASQIEQECNEQTKKKLNERLHAEQSYACGLSVRIRLHPKKYQRMKIERRFTSEELFVLAEEAIRRSGVVLD